MATTISEFIGELNAEIDKTDKKTWCKTIIFNNCEFSVKTTDTHFEFRLHSKDSSREYTQANRYKSNELWKALTREINISRSKDARTIARQFNSRFNWTAIAEYRKQFATENNEYDTRKDSTKQKAERLQKALGSSMYTRNETCYELSFPGGIGYGKVSVEHSIDFCLRGIDNIELCEKLCRVVREHWEAKRDGK